jgi:hypothetical protein
MLLDAFEKEYHLPTAFVKLGYGYGRQGEVVGRRSLTVAEIRN